MKHEILKNEILFGKGLTLEILTLRNAFNEELKENARKWSAA